MIQGFRFLYGNIIGQYRFRFDSPLGEIIICTVTRDLIHRIGLAGKKRHSDAEWRTSDKRFFSYKLENLSTCIRSVFRSCLPCLMTWKSVSPSGEGGNRLRCALAEAIQRSFIPGRVGLMVGARLGSRHRQTLDISQSWTTLGSILWELAINPWVFKTLITTILCVMAKGWGRLQGCRQARKWVNPVKIAEAISKLNWSYWWSILETWRFISFLLEWKLL